ncbi:MAG TPA: DUF1801 domain-containing protein [Chitinophagaceae bacterium]|nr:DUF1801 domain-containing protein [Chitinophagaceae bacterium]
MATKATTPESYLSQLPPDRQAAVEKLRHTILRNIPKGFQETISYGMLSYCVPHSIFPAGYHCNPKEPLPFLSLAAQKNFIALYHMGLYAMPDLLKWFTSEYPRHSGKKLDMGKSCIRFKKAEDIPHKLIAELLKKVTVKDWIETYQKNLKK